MSSPKGYELTPYGHGFTFTTEGGVTYYAYFSDVQFLYFPALEILSGKILLFGFHPLHGAVASSAPFSDERLIQTLATILETALTEPDAVIVYLLDNRDGKQHARSRKFRTWFRQRGSADIEMFKGYALTTEGVEVRTGLLIPSSHRLKETVVYHYYKMLNELDERDV